MTTVLNYVLAFGMSLALVVYCDVPVAEALLVGCVLGIFYTLSDISLYLRRPK